MEEKNYNIPEAYDKIFRYVKGRDDFFDLSCNQRHEVMLKYFKGGKLLDVGCLNSPLCLIAQKKYPIAEITVLDFAPAVIDYFKKNYPYEAVLSDCKNTLFENNTFDYITAGEIIEHMEKPEELIKEMVRILKPNGTFVLSTPLEEQDNECGGGYHLWSFFKGDIEKLLNPYGKIEIEILTRKKGSSYIIGFLFKNGNQKI